MGAKGEAGGTEGGSNLQEGLSRRVQQKRTETEGGGREKRARERSERHCAPHLPGPVSCCAVVASDSHVFACVRAHQHVCYSARACVIQCSVRVCACVYARGWERAERVRQETENVRVSARSRRGTQIRKLLSGPFPCLVHGTDRNNCTCSSLLDLMWVGERARLWGHTCTEPFSAARQRMDHMPAMRDRHQEGALLSTVHMVLRNAGL